ncbi:MAG: hypothetical protein D6744_09145 [Planctomycetota bacterium]|nr:MAG: hypothetical protein D6744_09145 [Planctomycetota bacterium]
MVRIACPHCNAAYNVRETSLGKSASCKRCGKRFKLRAPKPSEDDGILRFADEGDFSSAGGSAVAAAAPLPPPRVEPPLTGHMGRAIADERTLSGGFLGWVRHVGRSFLFFTDVGSAVTFAVMAGIYCIAIFVGVVPVFGWAGALIINGWVLAFQLNVLEAAAAGDDEIPGLDTTSLLDAVLIPLLKYLAVALLSFVPFIAAIIYAVLLTELGWVEALDVFARSLQGDFSDLSTVTTASGAQAFAALVAMWGAAILGLMLQPIMFLVVAVGGFLALLRWDLMIATIVKTFPPYLALLGFYFGTTAIPSIAANLGLSGSLFDGGDGIAKAVAWHVLDLYCAVLAMRAIGLFYHHLKARFAWSWG